MIPGTPITEAGGNVLGAGGIESGIPAVTAASAGIGATGTDVNGGPVGNGCWTDRGADRGSPDLAVDTGVEAGVPPSSGSSA